jgi:L-fuconolactonase
VLDAHVHFWDTAAFEYPLFEGQPRLQGARLPDEHREATAPLGIRRAICVEAACSDWRGEALWLSERLAGRADVVGVVARAPLEDERAPDRLDWLREALGPLLVGVRRSFEFEQPDFPRLPQLADGVRAAAARGLVVDLVLFPPALPAAIDLVAACPSASFVLDHLGKPAIARGEWQPWAGALQELAQAPNVVAKLSGLVTEASSESRRSDHLAPYVHHALECFGAERLLFGTDWPLVELAGGIGRWVETVRGILDLDRAALESVFTSNAERVYGIAPPG